MGFSMMDDRKITPAAGCANGGAAGCRPGVAIGLRRRRRLEAVRGSAGNYFFLGINSVLFPSSIGQRHVAKRVGFRSVSIESEPTHTQACRHVSVRNDCASRRSKRSTSGERGTWGTRGAAFPVRDRPERGGDEPAGRHHPGAFLRGERVAALARTTHPPDNGVVFNEMKLFRWLSPERTI